MLRKAITGGGGYDVDVVAWAAAAGGASPQFKRFLSTYVRALKASGVWPLLGRHYIRGAETWQQALTCLVSRTQCTAHNLNVGPGGAFLPFHGIVGNQTSAYIDWGVAQSAIPNAAPNALHLAQYIDTGDSSANMYLGGGDAGGNTTYAALPQTDGTFLTRLNTPTSATNAVTGAITGLFIADRIGSGQVVVGHNGTDVSTLTSTATSGVSTANVFELGENNNGTARFFHQARVFASSSGGSLGSLRPAYAAAINAFARSIGQGGF
jgi:hypothetical protein